MLNRQFACLATVALTLVYAPAWAADSAPRPNIIFILADDLGWTDLGCQGSKYYETPHIDRLASQGMRFTDGYTCGPNCQPTRAALMSGQYGPRTGVYTVGGTDRFDTSMRPLVPVENVVQLAPKKITVAESLKKAGYTTGMFGKWHLGEDAEHHPLAQGFDEAIVSMGRHFDFATKPRVDVPKGAYLADFLTDKAVDFVQRHQDKPFFLYLPHFGVHSPHQAKPELISHFKTKPAAGGHDSPVYAAMIASVDESVGRVMAKLDELKLADNTLVIFSSDNGGVGGYQQAGVAAGEGITDNAPLRGGKGMLYEGGVRVPFIFRWPGKIKPGIVASEPIISVDLYQTFLALAGGSPPEGQPLDGVDLSALLTGKSTELRRDSLYWHFPGYLGSGKDVWRTTPAGAIRVGDFKLLEFFETGKLELYNVREDIGQRQDLATARPELVREMHEKLKAWRQSVKVRMPAKRQVALADPDNKRAEPKPAITWRAPQQWKDLGSMSFQLAELPGQSFMLVFPEWIVAREMDWHTKPVWQTGSQGAQSKWNSGVYSLLLEMTLRHAEQGPALDWEYRFENGSESTLTDTAAFNCFVLLEAPQFFDPAMERTWVSQSNGEKTWLGKIEKTKGPRTMQFYPAAGGIELGNFPRYALYGVTSQHQLRGDRIGIVSRDGRWTVECVVDGPVAFFFNNWESDHGCIHASPLFGNVGPGKSATVKGSIAFRRQMRK